MGFHFRKATGIFLKTLPFVLVRLLVGVAIGLMAVLYFGAVLYVFLELMDSVSGVIALVGLLIAAAVFMGILRVLRKYVLYLVSAGHIAVIAHAVDTGEVPDNQLTYGKDKVTDRFVEASALFAVDQLIKSVVKQFNRAIVSLSNLVDFVPTLKNIIEILKRAIGLAASFIDEAILAHMFLHEEKGNWTAARDGIVLYGKTWKSVLGSTIVIVVAGQLATVVAFLALTPMAAVLGGLTPTFEILGWVLVGAIALVLYFGLIGPWIMTVVITTFLVEAKDETPDSETMDYVAERASDFKEMITKAEEEEAEGIAAGEDRDEDQSDEAVGDGTPT